jgi:hypothetical protein
MKFNPVPVIAALWLLSLFAFSQVVSAQQKEDPAFRLLLKNGSITPEKNITADKVKELDRKMARTDGKSFLVIQFENIPTAAERKQLQQAGIELLDYIPNKAYTATVTRSLDSGLLHKVNARAIIELTPEQKMQPDLAKGIYPPWAVKVGGTVEVWISFPASFSFTVVYAALLLKNFDITTTKLASYRIIGLQISQNRVA